MILVVGDDIRAEIPIEGVDRVLASEAAGLVCVRTDGGERMICEGDRGAVELVDKVGGCLGVLGLPGGST